MRSGTSRAKPPAWADVVLAAMGLVLVCAFGIGLFSSVPLRLSGSVGSLVATATWLGSVAANPTARTETSA